MLRRIRVSLALLSLLAACSGGVIEATYVATNGKDFTATSDVGSFEDAEREALRSSAAQDIPCPIGDVGVTSTGKIKLVDGCGQRVGYTTNSTAPGRTVLFLVSRVELHPPAKPNVVR